MLHSALQLIQALEKLASGERGSLSFEHGLLDPRTRAPGASTSIPPLPVLLQHCEEDFEATAVKSFCFWHTCLRVHEGSAHLFSLSRHILGRREHIVFSFAPMLATAAFL